MLRPRGQSFEDDVAKFLVDSGMGMGMDEIHNMNADIIVIWKIEMSAIISD